MYLSRLFNSMLRILRPKRYLIACGFIFNIILLYELFVRVEKETISRLYSFPGEDASQSRKDVSLKELHKEVTVVIREFEAFENDLLVTVSSILYAIPHLRVVVVSDDFPYPPLTLPDVESGSLNGELKLLTLNTDIRDHPISHHLSSVVSTPLVLFVPDGVRFQNPYSVRQMISVLKKFDRSFFIAAPVFNEEDMQNYEWEKVLQCFNIDYNHRLWTLSYKMKKRTSVCSGLMGNHLLLMRTEQLLNLSLPFSRPFPETLYVQTSARKWKVHVLASAHVLGTDNMFQNQHNLMKKQMADVRRRRQFYESTGIKQVIHSNKSAELFGCGKTTSRCFPTVHDDMPDYLYKGRWTPPCCLQALRLTARHVFSVLNDAKVPYWLEGGSLLGAYRYGDIIPWDFDVDIGIFLKDIDKCQMLSMASKSGRGVVDSYGFVWEKAKEGEFYRVQYSQTNRLHVDIFPFYRKNGIMTKDTWFEDHKQDCEFPDHFLEPLTNISFVGVKASAPNNVREFLEFKFGEGVIENPQYPVQDLVSFPDDAHSDLMPNL